MVWKKVEPVQWRPGERVRPMHGETSKRGVVTEVILRKDDTPLYYVKWDDDHPHVVHCVDPDELRFAPPEQVATPTWDYYLGRYQSRMQGEMEYEIPSVRASLKRLQWGEDLHKRKLAEKKRKAWRK